MLHAQSDSQSLTPFRPRSASCSPLPRARARARARAHEKSARSSHMNRSVRETHHEDVGVRPLAPPRARLAAHSQNNMHSHHSHSMSVGLPYEHNPGNGARYAPVGASQKVYVGSQRSSHRSPYRTMTERSTRQKERPFLPSYRVNYNVQERSFDEKSAFSQKGEPFSAQRYWNPAPSSQGRLKHTAGFPHDVSHSTHLTSAHEPQRRSSHSQSDSAPPPTPLYVQQQQDRSAVSPLTPSRSRSRVRRSRRRPPPPPKEHQPVQRPRQHPQHHHHQHRPVSKGDAVLLSPGSQRPRVPAYAPKYHQARKPAPKQKQEMPAPVRFVHVNSPVDNNAPEAPTSPVSATTRNRKLLFDTTPVGQSPLIRLENTGMNSGPDRQDMSSSHNMRTAAVNVSPNSTRPNAPHYVAQLRRPPPSSVVLPSGGVRSHSMEENPGSYRRSSYTPSTSPMPANASARRPGSSASRGRRRQEKQRRPRRRPDPPPPKAAAAAVGIAAPPGPPPTASPSAAVDTASARAAGAASARAAAMGTLSPPTRAFPSTPSAAVGMRAGHTHRRASAGINASSPSLKAHSQSFRRSSHHLHLNVSPPSSLKANSQNFRRGSHIHVSPPSSLKTNSHRFRHTSQTFRRSSAGSSLKSNSQSFRHASQNRSPENAFVRQVSPIFGYNVPLSGADSRSPSVPRGSMGRSSLPPKGNASAQGKSNNSTTKQPPALTPRRDSRHADFAGASSGDTVVDQIPQKPPPLPPKGNVHKADTLTSPPEARPPKVQIPSMPHHVPPRPSSLSKHPHRDPSHVKRTSHSHRGSAVFLGVSVRERAASITSALTPVLNTPKAELGVSYKRRKSVVIAPASEPHRRALMIEYGRNASHIARSQTESTTSSVNSDASLSSLPPRAATTMPPALPKGPKPEPRLDLDTKPLLNRVSFSAESPLLPHCPPPARKDIIIVKSPASMKRGSLRWPLRRKSVTRDSSSSPARARIGVSFKSKISNWHPFRYRELPQTGSAASRSRLTMRRSTLDGTSRTLPLRDHTSASYDGLTRVPSDKSMFDDSDDESVISEMSARDTFGRAPRKDWSSEDTFLLTVPPVPKRPPPRRSQSVEPSRTPVTLVSAADLGDKSGMRGTPRLVENAGGTSTGLPPLPGVPPPLVPAALASVRPIWKPAAGVAVLPPTSAPPRLRKKTRSAENLFSLPRDSSITSFKPRLSLPSVSRATSTSSTSSFSSFYRFHPRSLSMDLTSKPSSSMLDLGLTSQRSETEKSFAEESKIFENTMRFPSHPDILPPPPPPTVPVFPESDGSLPPAIGAQHNQSHASTGRRRPPPPPRPLEETESAEGPLPDHSGSGAGSGSGSGSSSVNSSSASSSGDEADDEGSATPAVLSRVTSAGLPPPPWMRMSDSNSSIEGIGVPHMSIRTSVNVENVPPPRRPPPKDIPRRPSGSRASSASVAYLQISEVNELLTTPTASSVAVPKLHQSKALHPNEGLGPRKSVHQTPIANSHLSPDQAPLSTRTRSDTSQTLIARKCSSPPIDRRGQRARSVSPSAASSVSASKISVVAATATKSVSSVGASDNGVIAPTPTRMPDRASATQSRGSSPSLSFSRRVYPPRDLVRESTHVRNRSVPLEQLGHAGKNTSGAPRRASELHVYRTSTTATMPKKPLPRAPSERYECECEFFFCVCGFPRSNRKCCCVLP